MCGRELFMTRKSVRLLVVLCPGCQVQLPYLRLDQPKRYNASGKCWKLYGELTAYNIERSNSTFLAQLAIDAYGAQHSSANTKPISTAFSLIGMYLVHEHGFRQVQLAHIQLGRTKFQWPNFDLPNQSGALTVLEVMNVVPGVRWDQLTREWSMSVWHTWYATRVRTSKFCEQHLLNV